MTRHPDSPTHMSPTNSLCHTRTFLTKWPCHLDACSGRVLELLDSVVNVPTRLGNQSHASDGVCRLCGAFLDSQLEHEEICCSGGSHTTLVSPGAARDVCVASAAAARGDAAQAAYDRNFPLSKGNPRSSGATTPSCHANHATCNRRRSMPKWTTTVGKTFRHRWKHEVQIAFSEEQQ